MTKIVPLVYLIYCYIAKNLVNKNINTIDLLVSLISLFVLKLDKQNY